VDFYYPEQNQPIFQFSDSLNNQKPELFFQQFVKRTCDFISIDSDSIVDYPLPRKELWEYYGLGRYYQLTGDYVSAEQMYRSGIAKDSTQNLLLKGLAEVLLIQRSQSDSYTENMDMETEEILYKAVDIDSTDGTLYRLLGNLYIQRKWWNKAEQVLEKAFQYNKDDPYLYFQLSRVHPSRYQEMGFHNKKSLLSEALFLDPAFQLGWIALGEDYVFYNQYDKAEEIYHQLLEIHPKSLEGFLALGKLYMVQNDIMNIIRTYEKVLEIAPDYADAYYNLGIIYYKENQEAEAIRFFQKAIELDHHPDSNFYLGIIYKNRGDVDQAIQFFRERIRLKTGPEDTFAEEARIHLSELLQDD
jgi:tetratricopeptide (TPR) repeat protein